MLRVTAALALAASLAAGAVQAQPIVFRDPVGDDRGPGTYVYPQDPGYVRGGFDIVALKIEEKGEVVEFTVTVNGDIANPWKQPGGWSHQFPIVFIAAGEIGGFEPIPGLNVGVDFGGWDYAVLMSPQGRDVVRREIGEKAPGLTDRLLVPARSRVEGRSIIVSVPRAALPDGDPARWAYQVVMQRSEGFPSGDALLMGVVNQEAGAHRFGGGRDDNCDPHVIDILAGGGQGEAAEAQAQFDALGEFTCGAGGEAESAAIIPMIPVP